MVEPLPSKLGFKPQYHQNKAKQNPRVLTYYDLQSFSLAQDTVTSLPTPRFLYLAQF
jgi:hypothetical protein